MRENFYLELFEKLAVARIRLFFENNKQICKHNAIDIEDVKQQILYLIWEKCKYLELKNPNLSELDVIKLIQRCITFKLNTIKRTSFRYHLRFISLDDNLEEDSPFLVSILVTDYDLLIRTLREYLSEEDYSILIKRFVEDKTLDEISQEIEVSKPYVCMRLKKILSKIKILLKNS